MDKESNLDPERWARSRALFERAVALVDADRGRFLQGECADDPAMLSLLHRMLDADGERHNALDRLAVDIDPVRSRGLEILMERLAPSFARGD